MRNTYTRIGIAMALALAMVVGVAGESKSPEELAVRMSGFYAPSSPVEERSMPEALLTPVPITPMVPVIDAPVSAIIYATEKQIVTCPETEKNIEVRLFDASKPLDQGIVATMCSKNEGVVN